MSELNAELYDEYEFDEAEGMSEYFDEEMALDEFDEMDSELEAAEEWDEESMLDEEFEDEYEDMMMADEYDEYESEEALDDIMATSLAVEDSDEFFGFLKKAFRKVRKFVRKAAPVVGRVARFAAPILKSIPIPQTQLVGRFADILGKLRAEGASEEEALEAFAELAARDTRAIPVLAGIAAKSMLKSKSAGMSKAARKKAVKDIKKGIKIMVSNQGKKAALAVPKLVKVVKSKSRAKGTPPKLAPVLLKKTAVKVAKSPRLVKKLARSTVIGKRLTAGLGAGSRTLTVAGPARITVSPI